MAESPHKYLLMVNPGAILTLKRYVMFVVVKFYTVAVFLDMNCHNLLPLLDSRVQQKKATLKRKETNVTFLIR